MANGMFLEEEEGGGFMLGDFAQVATAGMAHNGTKVAVMTLLKDPESNGFAPMVLTFEVQAAMHLLAILQAIAETNGLEVPENVASAKLPPAH